MINILLSLACALAVWAALALPHVLRPGEAAVPAVLAAIATFIVLARRTFRALQAIFQQSGAALQQQPPRFDLAVRTLEQGYRLAPRQFGLRSQVDTQVGVIYFLQKDFARALGPLSRSLMFGHWLGGAMLAVVYYKKKDLAQMRRTLEVVSRRAKKQGLIWHLYAYLLLQTGDRDGAIRVLSDGARQVKDDPRVAESLLALQNGKKLKMRAYREQWYQFHLERPPTELLVAPGAGRASRQARRGRW